MNKVVYFKAELKQEKTCEKINEYCKENNCEPISITVDKHGNFLVVLKER